MQRKHKNKMTKNKMTKNILKQDNTIEIKKYKKKIKPGSIFLLCLMIYLLVPFFVTFIYSIFTEWTGVFPSGFTLRNYKIIFSEWEFIQSVIRTIIICIISVSASIILLLLAMFVVLVEKPALGKYVQFVCMIPYALQGVILSISIISLYSGTGTLLSNRMVMLFGAYSILVLPYIYQGIKNNLNSIHGEMLIQTAEVLGCTPIRAYFKVVVPNIIQGIIVSALLGVSIIFGDFVLANNIAGNTYQNIQVYLYTKLSTSSGVAAAIVVIIFLVVFILTATVLHFQKDVGSRRKEEQ